MATSEVSQSTKVAVAGFLGIVVASFHEFADDLDRERRFSLAQFFNARPYEDGPSFWGYLIVVLGILGVFLTLSRRKAGALLVSGFVIGGTLAIAVFAMLANARTVKINGWEHHSAPYLSHGAFLLLIAGVVAVIGTFGRISEEKAEASSPMPLPVTSGGADVAAVAGLAIIVGSLFIPFVKVGSTTMSLAQILGGRVAEDAVGFGASAWIVALIALAVAAGVLVFRKVRDYALLAGGIVAGLAFYVVLCADLVRSSDLQVGAMVAPAAAIVVMIGTYRAFSASRGETISWLHV